MDFTGTRATQTSAAEKREAEGFKPRILVVDDVKMNLMRARIILERSFPCQILLAESGEVCLDILRREQVHLVLLDIAMPELSGIETLELIRQRMELKALPVVFLTASTDTENIIRASELGVSDYICKPFMPDDLVGRVKNVLQANGLCLE